MTDQKQQTVAIFGATGAQGGPVVTQALARGLNVRAIGRDTATIAKLHPEATPMAADLTDENAIAAALEGVDAAFLHLPMPHNPEDPITWLTAFINAAHRVSLPLVVYTTSGPAGDRYPNSTVIDGGTAGLGAILGCGIPAIALQPAVYLENLMAPFLTPRLQSDAVLDYPPVPATLKFQWTSHLDQAKIAAAALSRPDLAGKAYEIGTPGALTGSELAGKLSGWVGKDVDFAPITAPELGQRVGEAFNNPGVGFALGDLYGALAKMDATDMEVNTTDVESTFGVQLTSLEDHIASWPRG